MMNTRVPTAASDMKPETIDSLQQLVRSLNDSIEYHGEAAEKIEGDGYISNSLKAIAAERQKICDDICGFISLTKETPVEEGSWMGSLRTIWTSMRAGLNAGNATVVLIEAERAEDVIVNKFKKILPEIAGSPISDRLNQHYLSVKSGHDRVRDLRDAYQAK